MRGTIVALFQEGSCTWCSSKNVLLQSSCVVRMKQWQTVTRGWKKRIEMMMPISIQLVGRQADYLVKLGTPIFWTFLAATERTLHNMQRFSNLILADKGERIVTSNGSKRSEWMQNIERVAIGEGFCQMGSEDVGKGIPITGHEGPRGCGCKGPHIHSHGTRKR